MGKVLIKNKKASFNYELIEKFTAGIVLTGTEIKSVRNGKASLVDTYCFFKEDGLYLKGLNISEYEFGTHSNHEPKRDRKLLLTKKELKKLDKKTKEKGYTMVATKMFITERGWAKVEIAMAQGKKQYDKREEIKRKDLKRDMDRLAKY